MIFYQRFYSRIEDSTCKTAQDLKCQINIQVKVISMLTRTCMSRKNNFDLTELIVGPVSSLTWYMYNANNDQNPARGHMQSAAK